MLHKVGSLAPSTAFLQLHNSAKRLITVSFLLIFLITKIFEVGYNYKKKQLNTQTQSVLELYQNISQKERREKSTAHLGKKLTVTKQRFPLC